jgi:hypothetical protein
MPCKERSNLANRRGKQENPREAKIVKCQNSLEYILRSPKSLINDSSLELKKFPLIIWINVFI